VRRSRERQGGQPDREHDHASHEDTGSHAASPDSLEPSGEGSRKPDEQPEHRELDRQTREKDHSGDAAVVVDPLELGGREVVPRIEPGELELGHVRLPEEPRRSHPESREHEHDQALR
jgi:hypothetical protein